MLAAHHVDAEVGFTAQYSFEPFVGTEVEQTDADFRVALVIEANHRRQEIEGRRGDARQGHSADLALRQLADVENRVIEIIQQAPRLGQEITPDACQADLAGRAIEQCGSQAFLKFFIRRLNAGCDRCSASAASWKLPSSAIFTKDRMS